jgi:hypothetical protein
LNLGTDPYFGFWNDPMKQLACAPHFAAASAWYPSFQQSMAAVLWWGRTLRPRLG